MSETAAETAGAAASETTETQGAASGGQATDKSFTQADVDRIVQERLARAKTTPPADYEDLKAAAAKLAEIEEANKTELEKAQKKTADLERALADADTRAQEARLKIAVISEAAKKNVVDPDAALALLDRSKVQFDSEGNPTNISDEMDSLLTAKPYLVASTGGARGNADQGAREGSGASQVTAKQLEKMTPEEVLKAEQEGRLHNLMTGAST